MIRTRSLSRVAPALIAGSLVFGFAACGGDDDDDGAAGDTTATAAAATETTEATDGTEGGPAGGAGVEAFCQAELAAEAAAAQDTASAGPAFEALVAASPDDIRPTVEEVIANAQTGPGSPEFDEPYAEMIGYVKDNCGFGEMNVTAADYNYTGLEADYAAGPTVVTLTNEGEEVHEIALARINDDVTETAAEIVALPEEEAFSKIVLAGVGFAFPGTEGFTVVDLEPGRYIAVCFIPQGATPEVVAQLRAQGEGPPGEGSAPEGSAPEGSGPDLELGPPHHTQGMIQEFTVT
jgi:hypothetical protein